MCTGLKLLMKKFLKLQRWLTATARYKDTHIMSFLNVQNWFVNMVKIGRDEFLRYIQKSEMYRQFETHDGGTDMFWKKKIDLAFDLFDRNKDGKLTR
jgi:hypothetical protein